MVSASHSRCLSLYLSLCVCRVSYIFCDPVLACITVIPVLLLHRLPLLVEDFLCLEHYHSSVTSTTNNTGIVSASSSSNTMPSYSSCMNGSGTGAVLATVSHGHLRNMTTHDRLSVMTSLVSSSLSVSVSGD